MHEAVEGDQPDVIQLLILYGFNPDLQAKGGLTALHLAVTKEKLSCVRALIDSGADMSIRDDRGQDAINKAEIRSKKSKSVLNLLHSKGMLLNLDTQTGADPENLRGRWLTGWLPIVNHAGAKGVAG